MKFKEGDHVVVIKEDHSFGPGLAGETGVVTESITGRCRVARDSGGTWGIGPGPYRWKRHEAYFRNSNLALVKENNMSAKELQDKVWNHLSEGGDRTRRMQCLRDLSERGFFTQALEENAKQILISYLKNNPRGFCPEGIERLKKAAGLTTGKEVEYTVQVTVKMTDTNKYGGWATDAYEMAIAKIIKDKLPAGTDLAVASGLYAQHHGDVKINSVEVHQA